MYISPNTTSEVRRRIEVEKRIVKKTVKDLLAAGYFLAVYDGEEEHPVTDNIKKLHDALMETDEDYLFVFTKDDKEEKMGWVRFVYGNDGWDVICDYTTNLEDVLKDVNELAQELGK